MKNKFIFNRHTAETRYPVVSTDTRGPRTWCGLTAVILAAIITVPSFAEGEKTVASKAYVDARDALKQDKITSKTTGNVVTYNGTDANGQTQFDERGIFNPETDVEYNENTGRLSVAQGHEGDLVSGGTFVAAISSMMGPADTVVVRNQGGGLTESRAIYDGSTSYSSSVANDLVTAGAVENQIANQIMGQPTIETSKLVCVDSPDCTLWEIEDKFALRGRECTTDSDCRQNIPMCRNAYMATCTPSGTCDCWTQ